MCVYIYIYIYMAPGVPHILHSAYKALHDLYFEKVTCSQRMVRSTFDCDLNPTEILLPRPTSELMAAWRFSPFPAK